MRGWFLFFCILEAVHIQYVHAFICMVHLIMWASFVVLVIDLQGYFGAFVAILQQWLTSVWVWFSNVPKVVRLIDDTYIAFTGCLALY